MLNLVRMNLLKLFKMKSLYIITVIAILFSAILTGDAITEMTIMLDGSAPVQSEEELALEQEMAEDMEEGPSDVGITMDDSAVSTISEYIVDFMRSGMLALLLVIFTVIYACGERECGFLKNLNVCTGKRWHIIAAKMSSVIVFMIMQLVLIFLAMIVTNQALGGVMAMGNLGEAIPAILVQILLHLALAAFSLMIVELTRNSTLSMIIGIFISLGIGTLIVTWCCDFIQKVTSVSLPLANYLVVSRMKMTVMPLDYSLLPVTIIVGFVGMIGYLVISSIIFQKRDLY